MKTFLTLCLLAVLAGGFLTGCGQKPARLSDADSKAFAAAPAEAKAAWDKALAAGNSGDLATAITTLRTLPTSGLSPEQVEAVQNALRTYNVKLAELADKGDAAAKQALEKIKGARPGR